MAFQVRCHRCGHWLGESSEPVEIVGLFKDARQRARIDGPRDTWKCGSCGWANVFIATPRTGSPRLEVGWRQVELKHGTG